MDFVLTLLIYPAAFLFVFSIVVIIHELGHFYAARACGMEIEAYSVGFGRTLFSRTDRFGTQWRVAAIPLGGYVKFAGDANPSSAPDLAALEDMRAAIESERGAGAAERCFHFKPLWQRAFVVAAGPLANFVLAIVIFATLVGLMGELGLRPRVDSVEEGSPAAAAGFAPGDLIVSINDRDVAVYQDIKQSVALSSGERLRFGVERDGEHIELIATIVRRASDNGLGGETRMGFLGVSFANAPEDRIHRRYNPLAAVVRGGEMTWNTAVTPMRYIGRVFRGRESGDQLMGPIGIARVSGDLARQTYEAGASDGVVSGLAAALRSLVVLVGVVSVGIGLVNLMPIPILDGGHLVYYAYEAVVGRPPGEGTQEWGFRIGLALVLGLMVFVTFNDVMRG